MEEIYEKNISERFAIMVALFAEGNNSAFARAVGISPQAAHDYILGRKGQPGFGVLQKLASTFPQLRMRWVLNGDGAMLSPEPYRLGDNPATLEATTDLLLDREMLSMHDAGSIEELSPPILLQEAPELWMHRGKGTLTNNRWGGTSFVLKRHGVITGIRDDRITSSSTGALKGFIEIINEKGNPVLVAVDSISSMYEQTTISEVCVVIEFKDKAENLLTPLHYSSVKELIRAAL